MKWTMLVVLCACDGVSTHPLANDAPATDAPSGDAPPTYARRYVIDRLVYPETSADARAWSFDFGGADSMPDNQLGQLFVLFGEHGLAPQLRSDYSVNTGRILLLAQLTSSSDAFEGSATFSMFAGDDPDPDPCESATNLTSGTCARHLKGTGTFGIAPTSPNNAPLVGTLASGMMVTDPGRLAISIAFGDTAIALDLVDARVGITTTTSVGSSGVIAGAVTQDQIDNRLVPGMAEAIQAAFGDDCPGGPPDCGCLSGSNGQSLQQIFDRDDDCRLYASELRSNSLLASLLVNDVVVDTDTPATSFALRFTAVNATFTP